MSLNLSLLHAHPAHVEADAVIAAVFEDGALSLAAQQLDEASNGLIRILIERGDVSGKPGRSALVLAPMGIRAARVVLVGVGESGKLDAARYLRAAHDTIQSLRNGPVAHVHSTLPQLDVAGRDMAWKLRHTALAAMRVAYTYTATRKATKPSNLKALSLCGDDACADALRIASGIAEGVNLARELGNLPPNICTPVYLAEQAQAIADKHANVSLQVLDPDQMRELGMGALLAVGQGSVNPPRLIVLRYEGTTAEVKPQVLVGKGITFDTGGISIKPGPKMDQMTSDMAGAAAVVATVLGAARLGLPVTVIAYAALAENMPSGTAYRP
ncbi:MAG TPA: M17 family peptidase N-terminal domain-containing protein, partial [Chiayiivirga sp.]|nr:M17 family peptidase N-terminal domain-containing protein [Chiayiivirga sp.]